MRPLSFHILRIGLGITFLWIGFLIFQDPESWGSYIQPWAAELLPVSLLQAMIGTAVLDIAIGVFLLANAFTWGAALLASAHLVVVLITVGISDITVRDIGLLAATCALFIETAPFNFLREG